MNDEMTRVPPEPADDELRALAAHVGGAADRVDVERVAAAVVTRLRQPVAAPWARRVYRATPAWLRLAAALAGLLGASVTARALLSPQAAPTHFVTADLAGLDVDELSQLLGTLDQTLQEPSNETTDSLDDLDTEQLEDVLRGLEG